MLRIFAIFILLCGINQAVWAKAQQKAIFLGSLPSTSAYQVSLKLNTDPVGRELIDYKQSLNPAQNSFCFEISLSEPTYGQFWVDGQYLDIYIEPGDSIILWADGNHLFYSARFYGRGGLHNNYLIEQRRQFDLFSDYRVQYQMSVREPDNFVQYVTDIANKKMTWTTLFFKGERGYSLDFLRDVHLTIQYWRANRLLQYPEANASTNGKPVNFLENSGYYNFLNSIMISNPVVLHLPEYEDFLEHYKVQGQKWLVSGFRLPGLATTSAVPLTEPLELINGSPKGKKDSPIFTGPMIFLGDAEEVEGRLFYSVVSPTGEDKWCDAENLRLESINTNAAPIEKATIEVHNTKQVTRYYPIWNEMALVDAPGGNSIGFLYHGQPLDYLNQKTSDDFTFTYQGQEFVDHFVRVKTESGLVGWAYNGGLVEHIELINTVEHREVIEGSSSVYLQLDRLFVGKVLQYMLARDFYQQVGWLNIEVLENRRENYQALNQYPELTNFVNAVFNDLKERSENPQAVVTKSFLRYTAQDKAINEPMWQQTLLTKEMGDQWFMNRDSIIDDNNGVPIIPQYDIAHALIGDQAHDLQFVDRQGRNVHLSDYRGKVIILDFWASWCGPCRSQMELQKPMLASLDPNKYQMVYLSLDKNSLDWELAIDKLQPLGTQLRDNQGLSADLYQIPGMPSLFIINQDMTVVYFHAGTLTPEELLGQVSKY
jgi:thiol-disulfide isomerase/thioredoxin